MSLRLAIRGLITTVFLTLVPFADAVAQNSPMITSLVADVIRIDGEDRLTATGNIEVHAQGRLLRAQTLTYDRESDTLSIGGPIYIQDGDDVVLVADRAELDPELQTGIVFGARAVLAQQLQVAGAQMERRDGRFSDFKNVVASSCEVCNDEARPLWEIRARRVIHDQEEHRVYFYGARFRVAGVPVFYLPAFRLPDGTQTRVNGFLTPSIRTTSELGPGVKIPYFFTLGEHADLTLTPYIATSYTRTLEGRYRQAFKNGDIEFEGAISRDSIKPGENRGYLFGEGIFDIPRDYELRFNIETTTDDPYLSDYDYSDKDRLDSALEIARTQQDENIIGALVYYQSLRADEVNDEVPTFVGDFRWDQRWRPEAIGGWLDLDLVAHGHMRPSNEDIVGRDQSQLRGSLKWSRTWTAAAGLRFGADAQLNADVKRIEQDSRYEEYQAALTPTIAAEVSWPLFSRGDKGIRYLIEPVAQLVYTLPDTLDGPNDDSTQVALDTGNILSLNRFPGLDRYEEGTRLNLALRWSLLNPNGWSMALTGGRILREDDLGQFAPSSGLTGTGSNWLAQIDLDFGRELQLRNLLLMEPSFEPALNETRLTWENDLLTLSSGYIWQSAEENEDLNENLSEFSLDAEYGLDRNWSGQLDIRRDLIAQRTNRAKFGVTYRNECLRVDLSVQQRFRATEEQERTTSYGITVQLAGFGDDGERPMLRRRCANHG